MTPSITDEVADLRRTGVPRKVRFRKPSTLRTWVGVGIVMFIFPHNLIGVALVGLALNQVVLVAAGDEVTGRVVGRTQTQSKGRTYRYVRVAYEYRGNPRVTPEKAVTERGWEALREGTAVRVRCAELFGMEGAELVDAEGQVQGSSAGIIFGAVFWNGMLLVFWYMLALRSVLAAWLVRGGVPVVGRVASIQYKTERATLGQLKYTFADAGGGARRGSVLTSRAVCETLAPGAELVVFHHRALPFISCPLRTAPVDVVLPPADGGSLPVAVR